MIDQPRFVTAKSEGNDDQILVTRARASDQAAVEELLARHTRYILGIAAHSIPDNLRNDIDVNDILQELFLTLLQSLHSYDPNRGSTPREWLGGVTRISIRSMARIVRREKKHRSSVGSTESDDEADDWFSGIKLAPSGERPSRVARRNELRSIVDRLLAQLPDPDRDLLVRCEVDDVPHATVAAELGITVAAVAMRLFRIRQRCRELLGTRSDYL